MSCPGKKRGAGDVSALEVIFGYIFCIFFDEQRSSLVGDVEIGKGLKAL